MTNSTELFGAWLYRKRTAKRLRQKELEAKTVAIGNPIYQTRISLIETKAMDHNIAVKIDREDVKTLARAMGEDVDEALTVAGFTPDDPGGVDVEMDADTRSLVEQYRGLSEARRQAIREMLSSAAIAEDVERQRRIGGRPRSGKDES